VFDSTEQNTKSTGDGPVDAIFNALMTLVPHKGKLQLYQVHAVTEGTDAQAEVSVRLSAPWPTTVLPFSDNLTETSA
jgi:2-isopropylmalate synthase